MARPLGSNEYSDEEIIEALEKNNGLITLAAKRLGCSANTIRNRIKSSELVKEAAENERDKFVDLAEQKLIQCVRGKEAWAIALVLKTLGKNRGYVERQSVDISFSKPPKPLDQMTPEELDDYERKLTSGN
jgi:hypothetical protein